MLITLNILTIIQQLKVHRKFSRQRMSYFGWASESNNMEIDVAVEDLMY